MEDFGTIIYIIVILASIILGGLKKKKKEDQMVLDDEEEVQEHQPFDAFEEEDERPRQTLFEQREELLRNEHDEEVMEVENLSETNPYMKYLKNSSDKTVEEAEYEFAEPEIFDRNDSPPMQVEKVDGVHETVDFDLRTAVIQSELLKRKYF